MKSFLLIAFVILLNRPCFAASFDSLVLTVNFTEKKTRFEIPDSRKKLVTVNGREKQTLHENIVHAFKVAAEITNVKSNDPKLCRSQFIELAYTPKNKKLIKIFGCIGSKTPAALKLTELANLLTLM